MTKGRLEAFSDGVFAIIITIMVLELKVPHGADFASLKPLLPIFLSYVLSFINVGIYWNNHHHLFHIVSRINGRVLWPNLHLLFWLSLIPFGTDWMGENHFAAFPVAAYAFILMMAGIAYYLLEKTLVTIPVQNKQLAEAVGLDKKGIISVVMYLLAIPLAFIQAWIGVALIAAVAMLWLIPDKRIERMLDQKSIAI